MGPIGMLLGAPCCLHSLNHNGWAEWSGLTKVRSFDDSFSKLSIERVQPNFLLLEFWSSFQFEGNFSCGFAVFFLAARPLLVQNFPLRSCWQHYQIAASLVLGGSEPPQLPFGIHFSEKFWGYHRMIWMPINKTFLFIGLNRSGSNLREPAHRQPIGVFRPLAVEVVFSF